MKRPSKPAGTRWSVISIALLAFLLAAAGCGSGNRRPNLPRIFPAEQTARRTGKPPIIFIPGILGSELVDQQSGQRLWPELFPKNPAALELPITSLKFPENRDEVVASRIIESTQLIRILPEVGVYGDLLESLEKYGGYRRGDIDAPAPGGDHDTFYLFAYDWRRDNVESAKRLGEKITRIKERLNRPDLRFDIIAHSMGGLVARYFAMYGERDAAEGAEPRPDWCGARHIHRLVMFGTPNAGSMDALRSLLRGYSVTEANKPRLRLFRALDRGMIFSAPSVYQLLPRNHAARFYDADLAPISIDLFDAGTWKKNGWTAAYDTAFLASERRSLTHRLGPAKGAAEFEQRAQNRERYLRAALSRAAAFHRALDAPGAAPGNLRLHIFGGDCNPTLAGGLILGGTTAPRTLFYPGNIPRGLRRRAYDLIFLPGDGRVTRQSLFGLTLSDKEPIPAMKQALDHVMFGCEDHGDLPINPTIINNLLTLLLGNKY
ncbi:MAG: lipase/acyltransferase domain-containing protein [Blastocatellia bacterium]